MMKIEQIDMMYFQSSTPVPYEINNEGIKTTLLISPIRVRDWAIYENCISILDINKNEINNPKVIMMSYLEFLVTMIEQGEEQVDMKLRYIIEKSLGEKYMAYKEYKGKKCIVVGLDENKPKCIITHKDFDNIKRIILYQNIVDYDERYISPDVRKSMEMYNKIKNKGVENPNLEKKKVFIMSKNGMDEEKINNLTYRCFSQIYTSLVDNDLFKANVTLSVNSTDRSGLIHPQFAKKKDKFEGAFSDADSFKGKFNK